MSSTLQLRENSRNRSAGPSWFPILSIWPDPRVSRHNMNMYRVSPDPGEGRVHEATHRAVHTAAFHPFSSGFQAPLSGPRAALESGCFVSTVQCGQDQPPGFNRKLNFTPKLLATNKQTYYSVIETDLLLLHPASDLLLKENDIKIIPHPTFYGSCWFLFSNYICFRSILIFKCSVLPSPDCVHRPCCTCRSGRGQ